MPQADYYGSCTGPGPWHLLTPDHHATLCGRTQFHITRQVLRDVTRLCSRCITAARVKHPPSPEHDPHEVKQADETAAAALAAIAQAREALGETLLVLHRAHNSARLNARLRDAHTTAGYSYEALGRILGMTREGVRQRINRVTEQAMSDLEEQLGARPASSR